MIAGMASGGRPRSGFGCLSALVGLFVVAVMVGIVVFAGLIALGVFAALAVIGLLVLAVDRVALALSPKRRERRANRQGVFVWRSGPFPPGPVIDTTATLDAPSSQEPGPDHLKPE
jgi:type IV secretory pathway VirB3-like protein